MKYNKKISLIVINYNGLEHLEGYFTSLFNQTLVPDEIIMLDNDSKDKSREYVRKHFPQVKVVKAPYNAGTAQGSNFGFEHATGDYVIFHSNDIILEPHCIEELVKMLDKDESIGICTSLTLFLNKDPKTNKNLIQNAGGDVDLYGFGKPRYAQLVPEEVPEKEEVFFSYGTAFIIRHSVYKTIDGFDKRFFTLNDDIDLSWRAKLLGYRVFYTKKSIVWHKGSATLKKRNRAQIRYWAERNSIRLFLKNASLYDLLSMMPMYIVLLLGQMSYFLYRRRIDLFISDLRSILWNLYYLPETLRLRYQIQSKKKKNNVRELIIPKSFKLELFPSLKHSI